MKQTDDVIFRCWIGTSNVVAFFPAVPGNNDLNTCLSYEHVGQHGTASLSAYKSRTRVAKPNEYQWLEQELINRGYKLNIVKRFTKEHVKARQLQLARFN